MCEYHYKTNRLFTTRDTLTRIKASDIEPVRCFVVLDFDSDGIMVKQLRKDNTLGQSYLLRKPDLYKKVGRWEGEHKEFITIDLPLDTYTALGGRHKVYKLIMAYLEKEMTTAVETNTPLNPS